MCSSAGRRGDGVNEVPGTIDCKSCFVSVLCFGVAAETMASRVKVRQLAYALGFHAMAVLHAELTVVVCGGVYRYTSRAPLCWTCVAQ